MTRKKMIVAGLACLVMFSSCKADDAATKDDESPSVGTTSAVVETEPPASDPPPERPEELAPVKPGTFGGLVDGATTVTVTQRQPDGDADYGGAARTVEDPEWIAKFVTAVGPNVPGSEGVPRCMTNYTLTFANAEGELASFGAVCSGLETVVLTRDGAAYSAGDDATAGKMLRDLASEAPAVN